MSQTQSTNHRIYTDVEREAAVSLVKAEGGNYSAAARLTGIPARTIRTWCERHVEVTEVTEVTEVSVQQPASTSMGLLERLDEKIHTLLEAITPQRIAEASLTGITSALSVLLNRREKLLVANTVTSEEMERRQQLIAEVIERHVRDPKEREAIAAEFERLGEGDSDASATATGACLTLRSVDTDEGE